MTQPVVVGSVLYGADYEVAQFVWQRIRHLRDHPFPFENATALGVVRTIGGEPRLIGGIVFNNSRRFDIEMHGAFDVPDWCRPSTLRRLFTYPFVQLGVTRMTTITGRKNKAARRIDEFVGFKLEGTVRKGLDGREDAMIYGMLKSECKFLPKETN